MTPHPAGPLPLRQVGSRHTGATACPDV